MSVKALHEAKPMPTMPMRWFIALTSIGLIDTGYLAWGRLSGSKLVCLTGAGCDRVAASPYAYLLGIPVSYLGFMLYLALWGGMLWLYRHRNTPSSVTTALGVAIFGLNVAGAFFSVYLTWLSIAVIGATCNWCLFSAAISWLLLPLSYQIANNTATH